VPFRGRIETGTAHSGFSTVNEALGRDATRPDEHEGRDMMKWTAQRMDTLRRMWTEGSSSKQISEALGDVSRNAVMGKVDRMGLMRNALHNMRMAKAPMGACRNAMSGVGHRTKSMLGHGRAGSDPVVEQVAPVPAFVIQDIERPEAVLAALASVDAAGPEGTRPVDVLDAAAAAVAQPIAAPAAATVAVTAAVASTAATPSAPPPRRREEAAKPRRSATDLAKALKASKPVVAVRAHAERASRSWKGPLESPYRSGPKEPASFSMPPKGLMARVREASGVMAEADHRTAVAFVKEMGDGIYDATRRAHQAALVAIATVLARGDPRRILVPFMPEPHVLQMMRGLAEKAIVVAGRPPERWSDEETGDRAFFDDVMAVEGPLRMDVIGYRRAA
jgi:hypothetical protein